MLKKKKKKGCKHSLKKKKKRKLAPLARPEASERERK